LNLVFHFPAGERSRALRLERTIKTLPKAVKESLCAGLVTIDEIINPDLSV
jgi:predicted GIY-YIG superfamily endonuclease